VSTTSSSYTTGSASTPTSASAANTSLNRLVSGEALWRAVSSPRQRMAMRPRRAVGSNMGKDSALIWSMWWRTQGQAGASVCVPASIAVDAAATPTPLMVPLWNLAGGNGRELRLFPGDMTAFEDFGCDVAVTKPGRRAFPEFLALLADDDH